ncbi:TetR/AcrR family transcriptional regulator [Streptomyces sp. NPDC005722]
MASRLTAKGLTAKGAATRQRIVEGAAEEIRERGAVDTTLDDIRARTATSKSQLFHYFPGGKEELLLAVARHEAGRVLSDQQPYLGALTSWQAWYDWRDAVVDRYRRQGRQCPLGTLVAQLNPATPGAQAVTRELLASWQAQITSGIRAMQEQREIAAELDADRAAAALLAGIQGGVAILMTTGSLTHLEVALDLGIERFLAAPGPASGPAPAPAPASGQPAR